MQATRVLVVDDSPLIREIIADAIRATPGLELAAMAGDGHQALKAAREHQPDVVTLDVQMPQMDGLETLERLLKQRAVPVIMVSAQTQIGGAVTLKALDVGALDYVAKPGGAGNSGGWTSELVRKIRAVAGVDVRRILEIREQRKSRLAAKPVAKRTGADGQPSTMLPGTAGKLGDWCVAIGISTGGPPALAALFEALEPPQPPIVVVQHMPAAFTTQFAARLNQLSPLTVAEASAGVVLQPNHVWIAPGGKHLRLKPRLAETVVQIVDDDPVSGHKPSVDVMMRDAAELFGARCVGVIMTGMGRDGADGCKAIREAGGYVLGQDGESSDVYGMNRTAYLEGGVNRQFHLDHAAQMITHTVQRLAAGSLLPV